MEVLPFCACGCGERVTKPTNRFISGHNSKSEHPRGMLGKTSTRRVERVTTICKNCGNDVTDYACSHRVFCNQKCKAEWMGKQAGENAPNWKGGKEMVFCEWCGDEIVEWRSQLKYDHHFCCGSCWGAWLSINCRGENSPTYGRICTLEQRIVMSARVQGIDIDDWNGFLYDKDDGRDRPEARAWRECVFVRDNFICQQCKQGGKIEAHHIHMWSKYPDLRFDVDNGITLCEECHGRIRGHEDEYIEMFIMLMN